MEILVEILASVAVSSVVVGWTVRRYFDEIDRYVAETTRALIEAAAKLSASRTGKADANEDSTERS